MFSRVFVKFATTVAMSALMMFPPAAQAADLLPPPPPDIRDSIYDWSGGYLGGLLSFVFIDNQYLPIGAADPDLSGDGYLGGIYAGYNYQTGNLVMGIEGDVLFGEVDPRNIIDQVDQDVDFMATVRARLGFAHDRTMAYVTGGVAWLDSEISLPAFGESASNTHFGYVVGGGLEHAWTDNFVGRIEYLFADFEDETYTYTPGQILTGIDEVHSVRFGGAWKF